jgi:UPF0755 protein
LNIFSGTWGWLQRLLGVLMLVIAMAAGAAFEYWLFLRSPGKAERSSRVVFIQPGTGAVAIARQLEEEGVITDAQRFYWLCLLRHAGSRLKAGEYSFPLLSTPSQVLDRMVRGDVVQHRVTFPEGADMHKVARLLAEAGLVKEDEILRLAIDPGYIHSLGMHTHSLEGYLFPDTYQFQKTQDAASLLATMLRHFRRHFPASSQDRARELGFTVNAIVTLASMVEKEARVDAERPMIAAVFFNRLKQGMRLQSDPTAVYDLPEFSGPVTRAHLQRPSPYNTYLNVGLPPGPICNPGNKSLQAALYPADVPYLYFVSNNDGTHQFSTTLPEHNQAVRNYRQKLREQQQAASPLGAPATAGEANAGQGRPLLPDAGNDAAQTNQQP